MCICNYIYVQGVFFNVPVTLVGTSFKASNCISELGPQEPYGNIVNTLSCSAVLSGVGVVV
jgi:hypothetical protein